MQPPNKNNGPLADLENTDLYENILHIGVFIFSLSMLGHGIGIGIFCMISPGTMPDHEPFQGVMSTCVPSFSPG